MAYGIFHQRLQNHRRNAQVSRLLLQTDKVTEPPLEARFFDLQIRRHKPDFILQWDPFGPRRIKCVAEDGGQLFGQPDKVGTIEEGKYADLVVVDGDPSENIGVLRDGVVAVMKDGKFFVDALV